ncbi:MAG: hypothetical protein QOG87_1158, partial [Actinomycetota bacterium]
MTEESDVRRRLRAYARTAQISDDAWDQIAARTGSARPLNAEGPLLPSPTVAPRHARHAPPRTRAWPRRVLIGLNIFIAFCLIATASGYGYLRWRFGQIDKINLGSILRNGGDDDPGEPMNVLLV